MATSACAFATSKELFLISSISSSVFIKTIKDVVNQRLKRGEKIGKALEKLGIKPRAKVVALALAGDDPVIMLTGPIPASKTVLEKASMSIEDVDLYEVNEAFAPVPLAWAKELNADLGKLNVNGGAMALGHPLGGTGAKLMTTLLHELERREARFGLQAICEGGGTANAMIIERIS